jgi:phosphoenolpyruvate carboxykinase (ATP)
MAGGAYPVGQRIKIACSRALVRAGTSGALTAESFTQDPVFRRTSALPGCPRRAAEPRGTWGDPSAYDARQAVRRNFADYSDDAAPEVRAVGPLVP